MAVEGSDIRIRVDGVYHAPHLVEVFPQSSPFPGGHRFHVTLRGPRAERIFDEFGGQLGELVGDSGTAILSWLRPELAPTIGQGEVVYFLNRVDKLEGNRAHVRLSGECSPFVRTV